MNEQNTEGLRHIRRALLSVSDKAGLVAFARALREFGVELLSTGGTAKALREAGLEVRDVSDVTGFPEMLDGRVKTLHPLIHGGILAVRDNPEHARALEEHGIGPIDMVVVNLYPFEQTVAREGVTLEEAVEQIDIGGPAMVRSAAKNHADVAVVTSPELYEEVLEELSQHGGALTRQTRGRLSLLAFARTALYDANIALHLSTHFHLSDKPSWAAAFTESVAFALQAPAKILDVALADFDGLEDDSLELTLERVNGLRYGENPHQRAALYTLEEEAGIARAELLSGKEMSFN